MGRVKKTVEDGDHARSVAALAIARELAARRRPFSHLEVAAELRKLGDDCSPSDVWRALMVHVPAALARDPGTGYFLDPSTLVASEA
jgi:hypothetical protein